MVGSALTVARLFMNKSTLSIGWTVLLLTLAVWLTSVQARVIDKDPLGFFGIQWGQSLADRSEFRQVDSDHAVDAYTLKESEPAVGGVPVESITFLTFSNRFAKATIHYRGKETHRLLLNYLEAEFGEIQLNPGAMMRGLNQQYTWRGPETEITVTYRGLVERGFLAFESRVLASEFMNATQDQSF